MLLTHSCNTCYMLWNLYLYLLKQTIAIQISKGCLPQILLGPFLNTLFHFFFSWEITQQYHNFFCLHFNVMFFMILSNNKRELPANNPNLERDPLRSPSFCFWKISDWKFFKIATTASNVKSTHFNVQYTAM